jgi:recombinational DNA repair protein (RecF pathway)
LLFLWRFVELLGIGPDPTSCSSCGAELRPSLCGAYSFALEGFLCPRCSAKAERILPLGTGALRWLTRSLALSYAEALKLVILPETLAALKVLIFGMARSTAESPLASLEPGTFGSENRPQ